jgi:hypothetical protein
MSSVVGRSAADVAKSWKRCLNTSTATPRLAPELVLANVEWQTAERNGLWCVISIKKRERGMPAMRCARQLYESGAEACSAVSVTSCLIAYFRAMDCRRFAL